MVQFWLKKKIQNIWVVGQREAFEIIKLCFTKELYNPIKQLTTVKNHLLSTRWHGWIRKTCKLTDFQTVADGTPRHRKVRYNQVTFFSPLDFTKHPFD